MENETKGKSPIITGAKFGIQLLNAMGIDSRRVISFSLECDPSAGVTIDVKRFVTSPSADGLVEVMEGSVVTERFDVNKAEE